MVNTLIDGLLFDCRRKNSQVKYIIFFVYSKRNSLTFLCTLARVKVSGHKK